MGVRKEDKNHWRYPG